MRKAIIILFCLIYLNLGAQEESEISIIDVIESIEDVNKKLDRLMPENRIEESNMELGFIPITGRTFLDINTLNNYVGKSGEYDKYGAEFLPFINGFEVFSNLKIEENFIIGLNYFTYLQNTHGLHSSFDYGENEVIVHSEYEEAVSSPVKDEIKSVDKDEDGTQDYYSYSNYFHTGIELTSGFVFEVDPKTYFTLGPKVGYGYEEIEFAAYERFMFSNISPSDKVSWRRNNIILGGDLGITYRYKSIAIVFNIGFSYNLPLSEWEPVAGVSDTDKAPKDFNSMNLKISLGPVISFKF